MDSKKQPKWLDRFLVAHPDHVNELEQAAALHEFDSKMPRHQAEEKAYSDYRKQQHLHGAAHHLRGLKAAQASGDQDDARKHSAMLELHAKQAGFDPYSDLPAELQQHLHAEKPEPVHKFKAHRSDLFVLDDHKKEVQKAEAREQLGRILKKAELAQLLKVEPRRPKVYECQGCGRESVQTTNHTQSFHDRCPDCSWKSVKIGSDHDEGASGTYHPPGPREHKYIGEVPPKNPMHQVHEGGGKTTPPKKGHLKVVR